MELKEIKGKKIYVAGHNGMVGSAVIRKLTNEGFSNIIVVEKSDLDLLDSSAVKDFFNTKRPEIVILAAAKVGGIQANIDSPTEFLSENLAIQLNVISSSFNSGVEKFVFLGSSCIYPKDSIQPMKEDYLLSGKLETTNEGYALAKIVGLKNLEYLKNQYGFDAISIMPCNLYGPNDSFDLTKSHVLSALVRRFIDAKDSNLPNVTLWGSGIARREFMHVDDCADVILFYVKKPRMDHSFINVGWGLDISILELAELIKGLVNYTGEITWDTSKPDGMLKKCMDVGRMNATGFQPKIKLKEGIIQMINIYKNLKESRGV